MIRGLTVRDVGILSANHYRYMIIKDDCEFRYLETNHNGCGNTEFYLRLCKTFPGSTYYGGMHDVLFKWQILRWVKRSKMRYIAIPDVGETIYGISFKERRTDVLAARDIIQKVSVRCPSIIAVIFKVW